MTQTPIYLTHLHANIPLKAKISINHPYQLYIYYWMKKE
ncbi:MAG: hypothetical protein PARBA_02313 [Parabacteroides sp.]